jgi:lysophospholipase L1-like esterase
MVLDSWRAEMPVDLFAVMLGTNDLLSMRTPDASAVAAKMENLIHGAQESLAAKILLIAPPQIRFTDPSCTQPFVQGTQTYARQCLEQSTVLAQYYKDIAARCGVFYADASSWDLALAFDGVHLSLEANAVFARELEKVIRRL